MLVEGEVEVEEMEGGYAIGGGVICEVDLAAGFGFWQSVLRERGPSRFVCAFVAPASRLLRVCTLMSVHLEALKPRQ
jgi:hypothetical protein